MFFSQIKKQFSLFLVNFDLLFFKQQLPEREWFVWQSWKFPRIWFRVWAFQSFINARQVGFGMCVIILQIQTIIFILVLSLFSLLCHWFIQNYSALWLVKFALLPWQFAMAVWINQSDKCFLASFQWECRKERKQMNRSICLLTMIFINFFIKIVTLLLIPMR